MPHPPTPHPNPRTLNPNNRQLNLNDANKRVRIRRLGPILAGRRIRFKADCPSTKLLVHQLQEFPVAQHDDGPDALEMALRLATELLAGRQRRDDGLGNRLPVG